ncbi:MAG: monovalent cation/H(+) antiporter subunit G [Opitutales bacterium]|nr:monovalent cation/H(+) antiporter subunit G [Opitutales bacterium]
MSITEIIISFFILSGAIFILISAVGIYKLPDVFCRSHALGKGMTLGISLVLIGLWIHLGLQDAGVKVPLAILFQFVTIPVASHLLAQLAYRKQLPRYKAEKVDVIKETPEFKVTDKS